MINFLPLIVEPMWLDSGKLAQISLKNNSVTLERPVDGHISVGPKVHYYSSNYVRHQTVQKRDTFFTHPNFLVLFLTGRESQPSSLDSK